MKIKEAARERVLEEFEKGQRGLAIAQTTDGTKETPTNVSFL